MHELIQQWLSENGVAWKKKLAARTGCCDSRADELLPPTVETLFAVDDPSFYPVTGDRRRPTLVYAPRDPK